MTTPADINSMLASIQLLRTSPAYHAAEVMRRERGEVSMANSPEGSEAYAAIRLLIGTWEGIAVRVRTNAPLKIPFYKENPVGHMWSALEPAIGIIRKAKITTKVKGKTKTLSFGSRYAGQFKLLNDEYMGWLALQPADYRSAALGGIHAHFG